MPAHTKIYTIEDYENLPESVHAELIGGQMYYRSTPNRSIRKYFRSYYSPSLIILTPTATPARYTPAHLPSNYSSTGMIRLSRI